MNICKLSTLILTLYTIILISFSIYIWQVVERGHIAGGVLFMVIEIVAYFVFIVWIGKTLKGVE